MFMTARAHSVVATGTTTSMEDVGAYGCAMFSSVIYCTRFIHTTAESMLPHRHRYPSITSRFLFVCTRVQHNVKFAMPLSPPHPLYVFHHQVRSCAHVRPVAPRAQVSTRVHVCLDHARVRTQRNWCSATESKEKCGTKSVRPWLPPSSPQRPTREPEVAVEDEAAAVLEPERS